MSKIAKAPTKDDISKLVYCVATIQEIQRVSCVAPATLLHTTTRDVEVNGYKIPKSTLMIANLTKFMKDPDVFPDPEKLMPERFLQEEIDDNGVNIKLKVSIIKNIKRLYQY